MHAYSGFQLEAKGLMHKSDCPNACILLVSAFPQDPTVQQCAIKFCHRQWVTATHILSHLVINTHMNLGIAAKYVLEVATECSWEQVQHLVKILRHEANALKGVFVTGHM